MARSINFLTREGMAPQTHSVLSQKHKIYSFGEGGSKPIGVISSFNPSQSRNIEPVRGIGHGDVIAELVPGVSDPFALSVERTALYVSFLMQVFGYKAMGGGLVRALNHHRWPFDIKSQILFSDVAQDNVSGLSDLQGGHCGNQAVLTWYEGCWMNNYSASYPVDAAIITETADITVTHVENGRSSYGACEDDGNNHRSGIFAGSVSVTNL